VTLPAWALPLPLLRSRTVMHEKVSLDRTNSRAMQLDTYIAFMRL